MVDKHHKCRCKDLEIWVKEKGDGLLIQEVGGTGILLSTNSLKLKLTHYSGGESTITAEAVYLGGTQVTCYESVFDGQHHYSIFRREPLIAQNVLCVEVL